MQKLKWNMIKWDQNKSNYFTYEINIKKHTKMVLVINKWLPKLVFHNTGFCPATRQNILSFNTNTFLTSESHILYWIRMTALN